MWIRSPFSDDEIDRLLIPAHAKIRCAQRLSVPVYMSESYMRDVLKSESTYWSKARPKYESWNSKKGVPKRDDVVFAYNDDCGIVMTVRIGESHGHLPGCILTVMKWDHVSEMARA